MAAHWDAVARREAEDLTAARNNVRPVVGDVPGVGSALGVYAEALRRLGVPARDRAAMCLRLSSARTAFRILRDRQQAQTVKPINFPSKHVEGPNDHG